MKKLIILAVAALASASLLAFRFSGKQGPVSLKKPVRPMIVSCSPDWAAVSGWLDTFDIPPVPGAGSHEWKITTSSDSAQFYFNQGINMYYSFHIIEAMASFKKAAKFDPSSAMLQWAQALAYGPNINDLGYAASPDALRTSSLAMELSATATEVEKALIHAQYARYSTDSTASRDSLNQVYADKLKAIYQQYPRHADVAALYADALMLQHPWMLWRTDGTPHPWTPEIRTVLEQLLTHSPNHPGANHYYIHVMEASPFAAKALPSADRLGRITPALSHTVHMPSHIYLRTGFYEKGVLVNEAAVRSYDRMKNVYDPVTASDFLYLIHNLHMQTNNAMMQGVLGASVSAAAATRKSIPADYLSIPGPMGNYIQYIHMTPVLINVKFGNWDKLLSEPEPAAAHVYARLLYHFGRGMALSRRPKMKEAEAELEALRALMKEPSLKEPMKPFSAAIEGAMVAEKILEGTIAMKEDNLAVAIRAFQEAVETEAKMVYNEPRDWMLNPRHYLGDALIKAGRGEEALEVLEKDLDNNHENGWALFGCARALKSMNRKSDADKYMTRYRIAFAKSDVKLAGPVF